MGATLRIGCFIILAWVLAILLLWGPCSEANAQDALIVVGRVGDVPLEYQVWPSGTTLCFQGAAAPGDDHPSWHSPSQTIVHAQSTIGCASVFCDNSACQTVATSGFCGPGGLKPIAQRYAQKGVGCVYDNVNFGNWIYQVDFTNPLSNQSIFLEGIYRGPCVVQFKIGSWIYWIGSNYNGSTAPFGHGLMANTITHEVRCFVIGANTGAPPPPPSGPEIVSYGSASFDGRYCFATSWFGSGGVDLFDTSTSTQPEDWLYLRTDPGVFGVLDSATGITVSRTGDIAGGSPILTRYTGSTITATAQPETLAPSGHVVLSISNDGLVLTNNDVIVRLFAFDSGLNQVYHVGFGLPGGTFSQFVWLERARD